ncbi:MAG TPA: hypothetical protein VMX75_03350 [Spirochaetia bacterium]|nr:hypothetical protein [Spirochaetia bacterium]
MKRKRLLFLLVTLFFVGGLSLMAQSNLLMDEFLEEKAASYGKTVYLTLLAVNLIQEDASVEQAVTVLEQQGWGVKIKRVGEPINMGELSHLIMKALNIPGGIMYSIAPGPRYASRELIYLRFVDGINNPTRIPSGEEVVRILGRAFEWKEARS